MSSDSASSDFQITNAYPCLSDRHDSAGAASGHYFHQDLIVAQEIFKSGVARHLDVGSRIDGFVAHVASFMHIDVIDIRPLTTSAQNITFRKVDLLSEELQRIEKFDSVSCLHALEHFGLGRYGDSLNPKGYKYGLEALASLTSVGGTLYLAVPIGPKRIEFDAHRVFPVPYMRSLLRDNFDVNQFYYVDDSGNHHSPDLASFNNDTDSFGCTYGCGIFIAQRKL